MNNIYYNPSEGDIIMGMSSEEGVMQFPFIKSDLQIHSLDVWKISRDKQNNPFIEPK